MSVAVEEETLDGRSLVALLKYIETIVQTQKPQHRGEKPWKMQRQRRRDLNLKINRVLDKRSSRGMIFENEELRHRTLAIADDVDRGQNDIKKLRKENDHLKREIWSLRDECEKLEEILKKVVAAGGIPLDPSDDLPFPQLYLDTRNNSFDDGSLEDDDHMAVMRNMFMMDDDLISNTGSVVELPSMSAPLNFDSSSECSPEIAESHPKFGVYPSHPWGPAAIPPDLEAVREESESNVTSANTLANSPIDQLPPDHHDSNPFDDILTSSPNRLAISSDTPLIEITPASSPSSIPMDLEPPLSPVERGGDMSPDMSGDSIHDGGCVAVLPKMFQVTSEIHINNSSDEETPRAEEGDLSNFKDVSVQLSGLPPHSRHFRSNGKQTPSRRKELDSTSTHSVESMNIRPHSVSGDRPSKESEGQNLAMNRRAYLTNRRNSQVLVTKNPFSGSVGFIVNRCCPNFHSCYQSDPSSLATGGGGSLGHLTFDPSTGFCYPFPTSLSDKSNWNSMDTNLVVGYVVGENSESSTLKPQDIIDELEVKFEASLDKVKGIRMLPGRVFISFRDPSCVKFLRTEFGPESESHQEFIVKGERVIFMDGSQKCCEVRLSGISSDISDLVVISVLNQYGQVMAPLERRNYKGVDISERFARLHLVKTLPNVLTIGGYDVLLSVVPTHDCQDEKAHRQLVPPVSVNSCVRVTPPVNVEQARPPVTSSSKEIPSSSRNNLVTCHSSPVMLNTTSNASKNMMVNPILNTSLTSPPKSNKNPLMSQPLSSSPPQSNEGLSTHKQVTRSTSSNPRLESGPAPLSPIATKRQTSVCTGNILPNEHPSQVTAPPQPNNKALKVNGGTNSAPNLLPGNSKKPLSRLLRSSPGSFVHPTAGNTMAGAKLVEPHDLGGHSGPAAAMNTTSLRAAFYRGMSIDPRRGSAASQAGENNNIDKLGSYSRRNSHNVFQGRLGLQGHLPLAQMNSNTSSQFEGRDSIVRGFGGSGTKEPLPWCGCWGNGCI